jgi:hypothetical protein
MNNERSESESEVKSISIGPMIPRGREADFYAADSAKNDAAHDCYMLLRHMRSQLGLKILLQNAVRRGDLDLQDLADLFRDGCPEANGVTIDQALEAWEAADNRLMSILRRQG